MDERSFNNSFPAVLISACLLGVNCRYDGGNCLRPEVFNLLRGCQAIPVCPEQLGGLPTPRAACHLEGGSGFDVLQGKARVMTNEDDLDHTAAFVRGAHETLAIAKTLGANRAILKDRSPSCGCTMVWVDGQLQPGMGVTAALLYAEGFMLEAL